jgi:hypothetical protein
MKDQTESQLVSACLAWLQLHRVLAWRSNNAGIFDPARRCFRGFRGLKGVSDILGILPPAGRLLAVECKGRRGRLSPEQKAFLRAVTEAGGLALVVRDLGELMAAVGPLVAR